MWLKNDARTRHNIFLNKNMLILFQHKNNTIASEEIFSATESINLESAKTSKLLNSYTQHNVQINFLYWWDNEPGDERCTFRPATYISETKPLRKRIIPQFQRPSAKHVVLP